MPYVGRGLTTGAQYQKLDDIAINNATTFTMQVSSVNVSPDQNHLILVVNGVIQEPGTGFTVAGSTCTLASAITTSGHSGTDTIYGVIAGDAAFAAYDSIGVNALGVTAGTVTASRAVVPDSNKDIASFRNVTLTGELDSATLDVSGNADIDGTTNLDAVDIDGAVQIDATFTSGVDGQGYDTKFFGDTSSAYMLWDTSADDLVFAGAAGIDLAGDIDVDGTANLDIVDIDGAVDMASTLTLAGNADFNGDLDVDGTANLDNTDIDGTLTQDAGNVVFNEDSGDYDFRVESNGNANMLFVDGGNDRVGIGAVPTAAKLEIHGGGYNTSLLIKGASSETGIKFVDSSGNIDGYVYSATASVGFLDDDGEWGVRVHTDTAVELRVANAIKFIVDANSKISLSNNDSGTSNTILGKSAGASLDAGSNYNVFIGEAVSDASMNDAVYNVGIGYQALTDLTEGDYNICIGGVAGENITTGSQNVLIGTSAGDGLIAETDNIAIGHDAMSHTDPQADRAIAIGSGSLGGNLTSAADGVVAIGYTALAALTSGTGNVAVGYQAGNLITTATNNTYVGYGAGDATHVDASSTTAIGSGAFGGTHTGTVCHYNVAVGNNALAGAMNGVDGAVAVGTSALQALTTGVGNASLGYQSLMALTSGDANTAIGYKALTSLVDGHRNTCLGYQAMYDTDAGTTADGSEDNIFIGVNAGAGAWANAESNKNVSIGNYTMDAVLSGALENVAIGYSALGALTTGDSNVAIGKSCGQDLLGGVANVIIGYTAGSHNVGMASASENVIIGAYADTSATDSSNQIAIGYDCSCTANSTVTIGISGNTASLGLDGSDTSWAAASSDERYKENIETSTAGLSFVNDLRPVTYNWKKEKDVPVDMPNYKEGSDKAVLGHEYGTTLHGFIAQEVKTVIDNHSEIKEGFKMWQEYENGVQTIADGNLVPMLVKAVQELSAKVEALENA